MKLYFDSVIFGRQAHGGASNYWLEFFKRFFCFDDCHVFKMKESEYKNKDFEKLDNYMPVNDRRFSSSLLRLINPPKIKETEQIVFHSTLYRFLKQKNVINVVTIHDFTHQIYGDYYHRFWNSVMKSRAIKNADGIVCISQNTYKDLLKFYPEAKHKKCAIIYNGADYATFHVIKKPLIPKECSDLKGKRFILFVGNREGYKNFNFVERLLRNVTDLHLCLIGGEQYEKPTDLVSRIHHYQNVSNEDLNILYNLSYCFVYPSLYEGFGIPICEAMNAGCPVVAFNNSSIPEVMNGAGILLENNDLDGAIKAIDKLSDPVYRGEVIEKQHKACAKFSWDKAYLEMREFYLSFFG